MIAGLSIRKRFVKIVATWLIITAAILGVTASCTEGGMSQEGEDSEPYWR